MKVKTNIRAGAGSNKPTKASVIVFNPFTAESRCVGI
jgi:hypothetical protein